MAATPSSERPSAACPLCDGLGGELLAGDERLRVIVADEPQHPIFFRVIWTAHVAETTDLSEPDRNHLMRVVFELERSLRALISPDKVNVASLGNAVPHLHWHVIGRWRDDPTFPGSVWSVPATRDPALVAARIERSRQALPALKTALRERLSALGLREFG